jgi:MinD superfamily P-loop ATPase
MVLAPDVIHEETFSGGTRAVLDAARCRACGECVDACRFDATATPTDSRHPVIRPALCEGCGVCAWFCPSRAIEMQPVVSGHWFISRMRAGHLVHAKLKVGEENSGKLVSLVRREAAQLATQRHCDTIIIDGSPGIGCPVIASLTGATLALMVTEPTQSGLHDLQRVADLARRLKVPAQVCVNRWDLNPDVTEKIESWARNAGLAVAPRVRYDAAVVDAQRRQRTVVEHPNAASADDVRALWRDVQDRLAAVGAGRSAWV